MLLPFTFPLPPLAPPSSASPSSHLFPSRSLQPALGLETNVFRLCQLPLWTVNSGPLLVPPFSYFLFLPPWCLHPPVHENPSVLSVSLVPSVLGSGVNPSHSFLYAFVVVVFVRFSLFFLCCSSLLLLARFIAFYSSLSVRRCFCGNEDLETAWKRCQRGIERHCGLSGEGGVARLWQRNLPPRRRPSKLSAAPNPSLRAGGVCRGSGAFCFDELLLRMSHWQSANQQSFSICQTVGVCVCVCDWWFSSLGRRNKMLCYLWLLPSCFRF